MENKSLRNALICLACGMLLWGAGMRYFYGVAEKKTQQNQVEEVLTIGQQQAAINTQILKHYENIDSLNAVLDSLNILHSTKSVNELQTAVDSIYNR
jgi:uncharacterized membrane protein affecting hemolysin expression